jgi:non-homologous end joining protein Ku
MIETKRAGQIVAGQPHKPKLAPVIDLMEALKKSIAERGSAASVAPASAPELVEPSKKKAPKAAPAAETKPARGRKTG